MDQKSQNKENGLVLILRNAVVELKVKNARPGPWQFGQDLEQYRNSEVRASRPVVLMTHNAESSTVGENTDNMVFHNFTAIKRLGPVSNSRTFGLPLVHSVDLDYHTLPWILRAFLTLPPKILAFDPALVVVLNTNSHRNS